MSDIADAAADYQARLNAEAEKNRQGGLRPLGRDRCLECEEPISPFRRDIGARWCVECQTDREQRERTRA